jgi:hypothetical protein
MKIFFLILGIVITTATSFGQQNCEIIKNYGDFIKIRKEKHLDQEFLVSDVVATKGDYCYSKALNANLDYFNYLLTNYYSMRLTYQDLLKITDTVVLQKTFIDSLQKDSLFNAVMTEYFATTIEKKLPKDTVSMDSLMNIAVKYFAILRLNQDGDYMGKVCTGMNLLQKSEKNKRPQLGAFCFSSIMKNYQGTEFNMYDEFVKAIKELYKVNLGDDRDEILLRAQGGMFLLMRNNKNLRKMLISEYEMKKEFLPFVLIH